MGEEEEQMAEKRGSPEPRKDQSKMAEQLLKTVLRVPLPWLAFMLILIVLTDLRMKG